MRFSRAIIVLALAMVALPMLVAGADEDNVPLGRGPSANSRSLLEADTANKADHGGWGGYGGGGGGHYHMIPHGDHYHAVYHQPSYGGWGGHGGHNHGWGRKLMGADNVNAATEVQKIDETQNINEVQKVDESQTAEGANHGGGGWGNSGWGNGGWGGNGGHYDLVRHDDHYHSVYHPGPAIYNGWGHDDGHWHGRKLMALNRTKKPQAARSAATKSTKAPVHTQAPVDPKP